MASDLGLHCLSFTLLGVYTDYNGLNLNSNKQTHKWMHGLICLSWAHMIEDIFSHDAAEYCMYAKRRLLSACVIASGLCWLHEDALSHSLVERPEDGELFI